MTFGGRPQAGGVVTTVQGYYPGSNTVTTFAADPYPVPTSPGGVVVIDNIAYSFGGFDAVAMIDDTYFFDITAADGARWTPGPNLGLARSYIASAVVDGIFGPRTASALEDFQRNSGLLIDGVCGAITVRALQILARQTGTGPGVSTFRVATIRIENSTTAAMNANALSTWSASSQSSKLTVRGYGMRRHACNRPREPGNARMTRC